MRSLTKEEIRDIIKGFGSKSVNHKIKWITDKLEIGKYTDPKTGEVSSLMVDVVAETQVRFGLNTKKIKSIIEKGELASRTKSIGGKEVVSRKRETWWKRPDEKSSFTKSSLVFHTSDELKGEDDRRWYLQMFQAFLPYRRKNKETGEMETGRVPVVPKIKYIFDGEELVYGKSKRDDKILKGLEKLRPAHKIPGETWVKPVSSIISIK